MALLAPLKAMFEAQHNARPRPADLSPAQMRKALHEMIDSSFVALSIPRKPLAIERDMSIPVAGGEIVLRLYRANTGEAALPLHIISTVAASSWARWSRATGSVAAWRPMSVAL